MPSRDSKRNQQGNYGSANGRGGPPRNHVIPNEPPYTAYIGNAPESMVQGDFETHLFVGLKVKQVRLVRDRQTDRFRGFAYVDFEDAESLKRAIELDGTYINDRPIRIDVAVRPLGASKNEGFRNKADFQSRPPLRNSNNGYRQNTRSSNGETFEDGYQDERTRQPSDSNPSAAHRQQKTPERKVSNDDVFLGPDTPNSTDNGHEQNSSEPGGQSFARQQSRNWADCPIDETVTEPSPPPSATKASSNENFRNKTSKARNNNPQAARGRNNHNHNNNNNRGGRGYYEQFSPQYYQYQPGSAPPQHAGFSYHDHPRQQQQQQQQSSGSSRQRLNSNRSNTSRNYNEEYANTSVSAENRPRLQLLPRSQKLSSSTDDNPTPEPGVRNSSIFGSGKPRDERDPKLAELNKHIEEVVEKEQHAPGTNTADGVPKPVRILTKT